MPNDDVKTLREAAFAISIKYADKHMSPETRLYYDATVISFNRMADMIEREERELTFTHEQINERDQVIADEAWNAAIEACWDIAIGNGPVPPTWSLEVAQSPVATKAVQDMSVQVANAIRALRRGAS